VSRPLHSGIGTSGTDPTLVRLCISGGQLEEARRRLHRCFAMPQVRLHFADVGIRSERSYLLKVRSRHPDRRDGTFLDCPDRIF